VGVCTHSIWQLLLGVWDWQLYTATGRCNRTDRLSSWWLFGQRERQHHNCTEQYGPAYVPEFDVVGLVFKLTARRLGQTNGWSLRDLRPVLEIDSVINGINTILIELFRFTCDSLTNRETLTVIIVRVSEATKQSIVLAVSVSVSVGVRACVSVRQSVCPSKYLINVNQKPL